MKVEVKVNSQSSPWKISECDFPKDASPNEQLRFLLGYALLAPSSHNTQPWKFTIRDGLTVNLQSDLERWLRVADADGRELHLSVGCALENLLVAAEHFGFKTQVAYFPEPANKELIAGVTLVKNDLQKPIRDPKLFDALTVRHTHHKTFDARTIPADILRRFEECCDEPGLRLHMTSDEEIRRRAAELVGRSNAVIFADAAYREELAHWIGQGVFGTPWLVSQIGHLAMGHLNLGGFVTKSDMKVLASAPVLALITSAENDRISQVKAGQLFERIYLTAALLGIGIRPMSQLVQVAETTIELTNLVPGGFPLQPFLLGYVERDQEEHTPRRSLEKVLTY